MEGMCYFDLNSINFLNFNIIDNIFYYNAKAMHFSQSTKMNEPNPKTLKPSNFHQNSPIERNENENISQKSRKNQFDLNSLWLSQSPRPSYLSPQQNQHFTLITMPNTLGHQKNFFRGGPSTSWQGKQSLNWWSNRGNIIDFLSNDLQPTLRNIPLQGH
jgi:hypothetical protein